MKHERGEGVGGLKGESVFNGSFCRWSGQLTDRVYEVLYMAETV